jgi:hypothetical protein
MNSAIHPQPLPFIARPSHPMTPYIGTLQTARIAHITKGLLKLLVSFAINALRPLLPFFCLFSTIVSFVFNHIQPLFLQNGGVGVPPV